MKIGLVGLGRMGSAIAARLAEQGILATAWDRSAEAIAAHTSRGGRTASGPRAVAEASDIMLSIITADADVMEIFTGANGFLAGPVGDKLFIEMSTLRPATHRTLAPLVAAAGGHLIDSPVMGTIPSARSGQLFALVGGEASDVERARAVLDHLTRRILHVGPNGAGAAMKLVINLGLANYVQSLAETLALGEAEGLGVADMIDILADTPIAAPWLKMKAGQLKGEPADITLTAALLRKDVMNAVATASSAGVPMPASAGTLASLSAAVAGGLEATDIAEVPAYFRRVMPQRSK